jgi:hypothetical protein
MSKQLDPAAGKEVLRMHKIMKLESAECSEVKRLLDDFLSDELSIETNRQILAHLEFCPDCGKEREQRSGIRTALKHAWESISAPVELEQRIREETSGKRAPFSITLRIAAAFLIIILSAAGYFAFRDNNLSQIANTQVIDHYRQIVFDHLRCTGQPADSFPLKHHHEEIESQLGQLPGSYALVGIMDCDVDGAEFVHYVFRGGSGLLSIMVEARDENQILSAKGAVVDISGTEVRMINEGPLVVASLATPSHFVYIVGDGFDSEGTVELARHLLPPVQEALLASS